MSGPDAPAKPILYGTDTTEALEGADPSGAQMVLRALIDEGLKRGGDRAILTNVEGQV